MKSSLVSATANLLFLLLAALAPATACPAADAGRSFAIGERDFLLDGKPILIRCGEMHFARIPRENWQHRLRMARAMGLNAVCAYLFWNLHEPRPGQFVWTGDADAAEFCRIAQEENLLVVLRPGPYSCAEWELGGLPWWLLKIPDIKVRTRDPRFLEACRRYILSMGKILAPLQVSRGGPIIMVQVENEYGSYGNDREYIGLLRDDLREAGFDVPLFTCDGPAQLANDVRQDIFCVVNFGGDPEGSFRALRKARPSGPLMCGEYYPGWFDSWGKPHHTGAPERIVKEIGWMLEHDASFSIYMVHGGTTFGFWAGANCPPFSPQTTSYDYDAPISEAGWDTPKYNALRKLFLEHLASGEKLPPVPPRNPVIPVSEVALGESAPLLANLPPAVRSERPVPMESLDQPHGLALYRTRLPAGPAGRIAIEELHDFGLVSIDGKRIAVLDRRKGQGTFAVPRREAAAELDILVDAFGRVNYGPSIHDRKGITEKVELVTAEGSRELLGWEIFGMALLPRDLAALRFEREVTDAPAFHRASFELAETGDTFLDLGSWGKGAVWVNGRNLGRFWSIGPHQTLYCPGPWLRKGRNEIVVLELLGAERRAVAGLAEPILDAVRVPQPVRHRKPRQALRLEGLDPVASGTFPAGKDRQKVRFPPVDGRYLCLEALGSHAGDAFTTCAELVLLGPEGVELPRDAWKTVYADSEETSGDDGSADNVFDLQPTTFWHTQWEGAQPGHPHQLVIDLGAVVRTAGLLYLPRQDSPNGRIKEYRIYLSAVPLPGL